jgi:ADP-heptose:LPS heptosyltransferase
MASGVAYYKAKRASTLANPIAAAVFVQANDSTKAAYVQIKPDIASATRLRFFVSARGLATTGTTSNFLATIQYNSNVLTTASATTAITAANNTDFVSLTNRSYATITRPWYIDAEVVWDSTSQRMSGQKNGLNAETIETASAAITALTAIDLTTGVCGFVVSCIFGSTNASNLATLDDFYIEVM